MDRPEGRTATTQGELPPALDGRARVFPCSGCGAQLEFNIDAGQLRCPFCGAEQDLGIDPDARIEERDLDAALAHEAERRKGASATAGRAESARREVRCEDCGATTSFVGTLTSSDCDYCGAPLVVENAHAAVDRVPADGVLPFSFAKDAAQANLQRWIGSRWFAPTGFRKLAIDGRFHGVYLPYWTFDALTFTRYVGERGDHYWVTVRHGDQTRQERRTRWSPAAGSFRRFFDDVLVPATRSEATGLPMKLIVGLDPWPLERSLPFTDAALVGFSARTYDVDLRGGFQVGRKRMESALDAEVRRRIGGDEQRVHSRQSQYSALTYKHLLLPVWLLTYRFHGKPYRVAVNGVTGEVRGERPWSIWKILFAVLVVGGIVGAIVWASKR
jgi:DNA-directed RNA polymerase subunit RPC12/RpoP